MTAPAVDQATLRAIAPAAEVSTVNFFAGGSGASALTNNFAYGLSLAPVQNTSSARKPSAPEAAVSLDASSVAGVEMRTRLSEVPASGVAGGDRFGSRLGGALGLGGPTTNSILLPNGTAQDLKRRAPDSGVAFNSLNDEVKQTAEFSVTEKRKSEPLPARNSQAGAPAGRAQTTSLDTVTAPATASVFRAAALTDGPIANQPAEQLAKTDLRRELAATPRAASPVPQNAEIAARFYRLRASEMDGAGAEAKRLDGVVAAPPASSVDFSPPVLSSFVLEQNGDAIRIVDSDGSTYDGKMEALAETDLNADFEVNRAVDKDNLAREKIVSLKSVTDNQFQNHAFRASGSNVTLRQLVEVRGRLIPETNRATVGGGGGLGGRAGAPVVATAPVARRNVAQNGRGFGGVYGFTTNQTATVEGTVRIGTTNQQRFRAIRDSR